MVEMVVWDALIWIGLFSALIMVLGVGGIVADYVFPHIGPIRRWLENSTDFDEEE